MAGRAATTRPAQHGLRNGKMNSQVFCMISMCLFSDRSLNLECFIKVFRMPTSVVLLRSFAECRPAKSRHKLFGQKLSLTPANDSMPDQCIAPTEAEEPTLCL